MIVKSVRHFTPKFGYLVDYMFDGMPKDENLRWKLYHNLSDGTSRHAIVSEFELNAMYLQKRSSLDRKKTFKYHEILAFSKDSSPFLTPEKLQAIANEYFRLRDPDNSGMALCVPHCESSKSIHLHMIVGSNQIESEMSDFHMDNAVYYGIRRDIERFTLKHYPELHHSIVHLPKKEVERLLPDEILAEKKKEEEAEGKSKPKSFGKQTKKKQIADMISEILEKSVSIDDFQKRINRTDGFQTYSRNGKLSGVVKDRKKYRFNTKIHFYLL